MRFYVLNKDKNDYKGLVLPTKPVFERSPSGHILMDGQEVAVTVQCVHCNSHLISTKATQKTRGWCLSCQGVTCGKPSCQRCLPYERVLEEYESGKRR